MKLSNFTYDLPKELLAEYPSDQRDECRLMVLHRDSNKMSTNYLKMSSIILMMVIHLF